MYCVYKLTNKLNGKVYIGQTTQKPRYRFSDHRCRARGKKEHREVIHQAISKYGWESFSAEVVEVCNSQAELNSAEEHWIGFYSCIAPNGYNVAAGGMGSGATTAEIREKIAASKRGKPRDAETIAKMVEAGKLRTGENAGNARLDWGKVREIRSAYSEGKSGTSLAKLYGITPSQVSMIVLGKSWSDPLYTPPRSAAADGRGELTRGEVLEIRESTDTQSIIAKRFGIGTTAVRNIKQGKTYKWAK